MATIDVWGDESCGTNAVVYACLVAPSSHRLALERELAAIKLIFKAPEQPIHCSEMLNPKALAEGPWSHLDYDGIFRLFGSVVSLLERAGTQHTIGIAPKPFTPPEPGPWVDEMGSPVPSSPIVEFGTDDKNLVVQCAIGAIIPVAEAFGADDVKFHLDPDTDTRLRFFGTRRRIMDAISGSWIHVENRAHRMTFAKVSRPKPPLLEIADLIACIARRSRLPSSETTDRFRVLFDRLRPVVSTIGPPTEAA